MTKVHAFGPTLERIRTEQGFANAHAFYASRDGRRNLGLTYPNYLNIEKGRSLPESGKLRPLLTALGLANGSPQARELVRAYLSSVLGSEELLDIIASPDAGGGSSLAHDAARQAMSQRTVQLSLDQWNVLAENRPAYYCHIFLVNTPGWVETTELSKVVGAAGPVLKKALAALEKAGFVEKSGTKVRSLLAKKVLKAPGALPGSANIRARLQDHRRTWSDGNGKMVHLTQITVRIPKANLDRYLHQLEEAVHLSAVYGDVERTQDTAVYLVEGRIFSIFP